MQLQRTRRHLLQSVAGASTVVLAGCSGTDEKPTETVSSPMQTGTTAPTSTPTPTDEPTSTADPTETPTDEPTETPTETPTPPPQQRYRFGEWHKLNDGEWHKLDDWEVTISEMELLETFETNDGEQYDMPDDEQLLITTPKMRNTSSERRLFGSRFVAITDDQSYDDRPSFSHPELGGVGFDELQQVDHQRQFAPQGIGVEAGETGRYWSGFVLPRTVERTDIEIALSGREDEGHPIRWIPDE